MNDLQFQVEFFKQLKHKIAIGFDSYRFRHGIMTHLSADEYEKLAIQEFIDKVYKEK